MKTERLPHKNHIQKATRNTHRESETRENGGGRSGGTERPTGRAVAKGFGWGDIADAASLVLCSAGSLYRHQRLLGLPRARWLLRQALLRQSRKLPGRQIGIVSQQLGKTAGQLG